MSKDDLMSEICRPCSPKEIEEFEARMAIADTVSRLTREVRAAPGLVPALLKFRRLAAEAFVRASLLEHGWAEPPYSLADPGSEKARPALDRLFLAAMDKRNQEVWRLPLQYLSLWLYGPCKTGAPVKVDLVPDSPQGLTGQVTLPPVMEPDFFCDAEESLDALIKAAKLAKRALRKQAAQIVHKHEEDVDSQTPAGSFIPHNTYSRAFAGHLVEYLSNPPNFPPWPPKKIGQLCERIGLSDFSTPDAIRSLKDDLKKRRKAGQ